MKMPGIRIDRLEVRLRGVSPELARTLSRELGHGVLEQLVRERLFFNGKPGAGDSRVSRIAPAPLKIKGDETSSDVGQRIAARIVESISTRNGANTVKKG
ncbi:MAG: hypothetical protein GY737_17955 [Desulfobacteraceae bacterium]|nr:hypothetical protein [Desulfobacteraceae bacterium]